MLRSSQSGFTPNTFHFTSQRLCHYADELEREADPVLEAARPPKEWPANGAIELKQVVMSYRAGLPPVLKGLSLSVGAGEKIGVVGRCGGHYATTRRARR